MYLDRQHYSQDIIDELLHRDVGAMSHHIMATTNEVRSRAFRNAVKWIWSRTGAVMLKSIEHQRVRRHLEGLDAHLLADIGLARTEITAAIEGRLLRPEPFVPSELLAHAMATDVRNTRRRREVRHMKRQVRRHRPAAVATKAA